MPLSYDTIAAVLASHTADQAFSLPPLPISRDNGILMYRVAEAVAHAFLGEGNGQPPLLPGSSAGAQNFAKDVIVNAEPAIRRLEGLAPHVKAFKGVAEEAFLSTFGGPDGHENRRPLIKLLFNAEGEQACYNFIKNVVTRMLHASSELNSVDKRLFIGFRDFHLNSSTAWLRAKTLLAARDYARKIMQEHARRQAAANSTTIAGETHMNSLAQLTARQARRSLVSAEELRRRWAA